MASKPERAVRAALLRLGQRFDCNVEGVPGRPDISLADHRAIFVHGCLWHGHYHVRVPEHLEDKIKKNRERDRATEARLVADHTPWRLLTVWECETRNFDSLRDRISDFLKN